MSGVTDGTTPDPTAHRFDTANEAERETGIASAALAVQRGELIVLPTDTVYGVGADAFDADAVAALLAAKGRGREMPPPVLVSTATTLDALAVDVPDYARALIKEFWPVPLTVVCKQQASLRWDLGDARGTVAVRMPDHEVTLELLERTGPLAVSSANKTGQLPARDVDAAEEMLGEHVALIVDAGPTLDLDPSTIVDVTTSPGRVLRRGVLSLEQLNAVLEPLGVTLTDDV